MSETKNSPQASTKTQICLLWAGSSVSNFDGADINIEVISRKIKNMESSPPNVLFRTHQYEFVIKPNEEFIKMCGDKKRGYFVDLKLFKKVDQTQGKFQEYNLCGLPVISYAFTEDCINGIWTCILDWQDNTKTSFKGDFCFKVSVYKKVDDESFKRVFSKISSSFVIVSKPNQNKRKNQSDKFQDVPQVPNFEETLDAPVIKPKDDRDDTSFKHPLHQMPQPMIHFPIMTPSPHVFKIEPRLLPKGGNTNIQLNVPIPMTSSKTLATTTTEETTDSESKKVGFKRKNKGNEKTTSELEDDLLAEEDELYEEEPPKKKTKEESIFSKAALKLINEKQDDKSPILSQEIRFSQEFKGSQEGKSKGLLSLSFSQNSQEGNLFSPTPTPNNDAQGEIQWDQPLPSPSVQTSQLYSLNSQFGTLSQSDFKLSSSYDFFFDQKLDK